MDNREQFIRMFKGDTLAFNMEFSGLPDDLSAASFSVKESLEESDDAEIELSLDNGISKVSDGLYLVRVAPSDTEDVNPGRYYYSLSVSISGDTYTIMYGIINILLKA